MFWAPQFMDATPGGTISFTGIRFDITVSEYSNAASSRPYLGSYLVVNGASVAVVPEPATALLAALGGLMLAGALRGARRGKGLQNKVG